jgi:hypothetical protein
MLSYYLYGFVAVGGAVFASNLYHTDPKMADLEAVLRAGTRALRYGAPWPMTLLNLHTRYTKGEEWMEIFRPR